MKVEKLSKKQEQQETSHTKSLSGVESRPWLGAWQEWASIVSLFLMLYIVVRSMTQAEWITPQPSLVLVLVLALAIGLVLGKSRVPGLAAHTLALILGVGITMWQGANLQSGIEMTAKFSRLIRQLELWWQATSSGEPSPGTIQIALMFSLVIWLMGYVSIWLILRKRNPWVAISLGTTALLINLSSLSEEYYGYFLWYLLTALFLVALTTAVQHFSWFGKQAINHVRLGIKYFLPSFLALSILLLSVSWLIPQFRAHPLETFARTQLPWYDDINEFWYNFFAEVSASKPAANHDSQEVVTFSSSPNLSDKVMYIVKTERPNYWWTKIYDVYSSTGWLTSSSGYQVLEAGATRSEAESFPSHSELTYTVIPQVPTNVLLNTGEFISSDIPIIVETITPADVIAVTSSQPLAQHQGYTVTAHISTATTAQLSQAGEAYPQWVTDRYLQLPPDFPENIRQLAEKLTNGLLTPYDKATVIAGFLSHLPYTWDVTAPPPGVDGVEYFLSTTKAGYCVQFASAMAVMLRSVGVPTRLNLGYLGGQWDREQEGYVIRAQDYHTWPEIYFPGYGWIIFEASPGRTAEAFAGEPVIPVTGATIVEPIIPVTETAGIEPVIPVEETTGGEPPIPTGATAGGEPPIPTGATAGGEPVIPATETTGEDNDRSIFDVDYFRYLHDSGWPIYDTEGNLMGYGWPIYDEEAESGWPIYDAEGNLMGYEYGLPYPIYDAEGNLMGYEYGLPILAEGTPDESGLPIIAQDTPDENLPIPMEDAPDEDSSGPSQNITTLETPAVSLHWAVLVGITTIILIVGLASYQRLARSARRDIASAVYARMCLLASLIRLGPQPQQTALEYSTRLSGALTHQTEAISSIAEVYVTTRYSRNKTLTVSQKQELQQYWHRVRRALFLRLFRIK